ncbi:MAG: JAB domain-containing protein [Eubacteriales bacterium]|nr:JAB domain-containing protein [Eubacteriales bacterium]
MNNELYQVPHVSTRLMLMEDRTIYSTTQINSPADIVKLMREQLKTLDCEHCLVANVDVKNRPLNISTVSIGDLSGSIVPIRSVFKSAILSGASRIMLFHNHPSGDVTPSNEDMRITKRVIAAGQILGIHLIDHIIVGSDGDFFSFLQNVSDLFNGEQEALSQDYLSDLLKDNTNTH